MWRSQRDLWGHCVSGAVLGPVSTLATAGSCLEIMVWNWVVFMVGASSADFWNSVTSVLMASSRSEYWGTNNQSMINTGAGKLILNDELNQTETFVQLFVPCLTLHRCDVSSRVDSQQIWWRQTVDQDSSLCPSRFYMYHSSLSKHSTSFALSFIVLGTGSLGQSLCQQAAFTLSQSAAELISAWRDLRLQVNTGNGSWAGLSHCRDPVLRQTEQLDEIRPSWSLLWNRAEAAEPESRALEKSEPCELHVRGPPHTESLFLSFCSINLSLSMYHPCLLLPGSRSHHTHPDLSLPRVL